MSVNLSLRLFSPQRGWRRHREAEPAPETVHVSIRPEQLADPPVGHTAGKRTEGQTHISCGNSDIFNIIKLCFTLYWRWLLCFHNFAENFQLSN